MEGLSHYNTKQEVFSVLNYPSAKTLKDTAIENLYYCILTLKDVADADDFSAMLQDYDTCKTLDASLKNHIPYI